MSVRDARDAGERAPRESRGLDVMRARVAFRDRPWIDVMDLAVRFLVVHIRLYAKMALFVLAPCLLITLGAAEEWGWLGGWSVALALSFVAQVPFTVLASRLVFQERVSARAVVRSAARDLPRILIMRITWALLIALSLSCLVFPSAYVGSVLLFVDEVMVLERGSITGSLGRSQRITSSSVGDSLLGVFTVVAVPLIAVFLAEYGGRAFIVEILQIRAPAPLWEHGYSTLTLLGFFGIIPYVTTVRFFMYLNMRTRAEGWDIQTRFASIAARADQEQPA